MEGVFGLTNDQEILVDYVQSYLKRLGYRQDRIMKAWDTIKYGNPLSIVDKQMYKDISCAANSFLEDNPNAIVTSTNPGDIFVHINL